MYIVRSVCRVFIFVFRAERASEWTRSCTHFLFLVILPGMSNCTGGRMPINLIAHIFRFEGQRERVFFDVEWWMAYSCKWGGMLHVHPFQQPKVNCITSGILFHFFFVFVCSIQWPLVGNTERISTECVVGSWVSFASDPIKERKPLLAAKGIAWEGKSLPF